MSFKVDRDLAKICAKIIEEPELCLIPLEYIEAAKEWKEKQLDNFALEKNISNIDYSRIERGSIIFLNMMYCQAKLLSEGYFYETEHGKKENPAGPALRAYINQMKDWEKEMINRLENMSVGGQSSHGNSKKINPALSLITGTK